MDDKFVTRDKAEPLKSEKPGEEKASGGFMRILRFVFVKNIGLKAAAVLTAAAMWALIVGLS